IDSSEYRVVFPETKERKQMVESLTALLSGSMLEEGYKRMISEKLPRLLDWQLQSILLTLKEERDALGQDGKNKSK
ncbi:MAG: hypothetical protein HYW88_03455, partial [Candidatus Sungbacteria bacterium]|nr:hypothetical protein [Candidatus Sungbacteria bacterium]